MGHGRMRPPIDWMAKIAEENDRDRQRGLLWKDTIRLQSSATLTPRQRRMVRGMKTTQGAYTLTP